MVDRSRDSEDLTDTRSTSAKRDLTAPETTDTNWTKGDSSSDEATSSTSEEAHASPAMSTTMAEVAGLAEATPIATAPLATSLTKAGLSSGAAPVEAVAGFLPADMAVMSPGVMYADPDAAFVHLQTAQAERAADVADAKADYLRELSKVEQVGAAYLDAVRANDPAAMIEARAALMGVRAAADVTRSRLEQAETDASEVGAAIAQFDQQYPGVVEAATGLSGDERALLDDYHELDSSVSQLRTELEVLGDWRVQQRLELETAQWSAEATIASAQLQGADLHLSLADAAFRSSLLSASVEATMALANPVTYFSMGLSQDEVDAFGELLMDPFSSPHEAYALLISAQILPADSPAMEQLLSAHTTRQDAQTARVEAFERHQHAEVALFTLDMAAAQRHQLLSQMQLELHVAEGELASFEAQHGELDELLAAEAGQADFELASAQRQVSVIEDARLAHLERVLDQLESVDASADLSVLALSAGSLTSIAGATAASDAFDDQLYMAEMAVQDAQSELDALLDPAAPAAEGFPVLSMVEATFSATLLDSEATGTEPSDAKPMSSEPPTRVRADDDTDAGDRFDTAFGVGRLPADEPLVRAERPVRLERDEPDGVTSVEQSAPGQGPPPTDDNSTAEPPMSSVFAADDWSWVDDADLWFNGATGTFHPAPGAPALAADEAPTVVVASAGLLADAVTLGVSHGAQFTGRLEPGSALAPGGPVDGDDLFFDARTGAFHQGTPEGPVVGFHQSAVANAVHVPNRGSWFEAERQLLFDRNDELVDELSTIAAEVAALEERLSALQVEGGRGDLATTATKQDALSADFSARGDWYESAGRDRAAAIEAELAALEGRQAAIDAELWLVSDTLGYPSASPYASWSSAELRYLLGDDVMDTYDGIDLSYEETAYAYLGGGDVVNVNGTWFEHDGATWAARDWPTVLSFGEQLHHDPLAEHLWHELAAGTALEGSHPSELALYLDGTTGSMLTYDPGAWEWVDSPSGVGGWWEDSSGVAYDRPGGPMLGEGELSTTGWYSPEVSVAELVAVAQVGGGSYWVDLSTGSWLAPGAGVLPVAQIPPGPFLAVGVDAPDGHTWYVNPTTGTFHSDGGSGAPPVLGPDGIDLPVVGLSPAALAGSVGFTNAGIGHEAMLAEIDDRLSYLEYASQRATADGDVERAAEIETERTTLFEQRTSWYEDSSVPYADLAGGQVAFVGGQWFAADANASGQWFALEQVSPYLDLGLHGNVTEFVGHEAALGTALYDIGPLGAFGVVVDGATGELHAYDPTRWEWVESDEGGWWSGPEGGRHDAPNGAQLGDGQYSSLGFYDSRLPIEHLVVVRDADGREHLYDSSSGSFTAVDWPLSPNPVDPAPPVTLTMPGPFGSPIGLDVAPGTLLQVDLDHGVLRAADDGAVVGGLPGSAVQRWEIDGGGAEPLVWFTTATHAFGPAGEVVEIPPYALVADMPGPLRDAVIEAAGLEGDAEFAAADSMWLDPATGEVHLWNPVQWSWDPDAEAWYDEEAGTYHVSPVDPGEPLDVVGDGAGDESGMASVADDEAGEPVRPEEHDDEARGDRIAEDTDTRDDRIEEADALAFGSGSGDGTGEIAERPLREPAVEVSDGREALTRPDVVTDPAVDSEIERTREVALEPDVREPVDQAAADLDDSEAFDA